MRVSLFVVALLALLCAAEAQRYFTQVTPITAQWSARQKANVEFVKRTTIFRDGLRTNAGQVTLTNYFVSSHLKLTRTRTSPALRLCPRVPPPSDLPRPLPRPPLCVPLHLPQLLYGGQSNQGAQNDVWASTNGRSWVWAAGYADGEEHPYPLYAETFPRVFESAHCQDSQYRQFRVGGRLNGQVFNDVWMSIDGSRWTEQTAAGEFEPVYLANMVGDSTGYIYLAGGILDDQGNPRRSTGSVWQSTNAGRTWRQMSSGYSPQTGLPNGPGERAVSILLNSDTNTLIWLTGVNTGYGTNDRPESYQKDVWVSTNLGRTFDPVNLNTPFGRRDDSNAEIASSGLMVLAGGYGGTGQGQERTNEIYNVPLTAHTPRTHCSVPRVDRLLASRMLTVLLCLHPVPAAQDVWVSANGGYSWSGLSTLSALRAGRSSACSWLRR